MPKKSHVPAYRLHKATGQAVVVVDGKSFYLGKYGTPESQAEYDRISSSSGLPEDGRSPSARL